MISFLKNKKNTKVEYFDVPLGRYWMSSIISFEKYAIYILTFDPNLVNLFEFPILINTFNDSFRLNLVS